MNALVDHNSKAWDQKVETGNEWTVAVEQHVIEQAKKGNWDIRVTPMKDVPRDWFPPVNGLKVLCLASGGGQQGPILAAAGADVTVLDNSEKQLDQDRIVAERDDLRIHTVKGSMDDLSQFQDESFDVIVHPVANVFVENVLPVWKEAHRVLKRNGTLISGFVNPVVFLFDVELEQQGILKVKHSIPYADSEDLPKHKVKKLIENNEALEFGHSLEDQIKGQIDAGFIVTGFYEDKGGFVLDQYIHTYSATRSVKV
ncbi:class I SAM-dependent methyltransferase [Bacillus vallismortis]|uniref:class I SAM-dependent methyltransferase n=1 Tax=Bacillus vallismortis TaxID=72361 RepID=UPI000EF44AD9|nr:class I SAM-dependent methyltransferase [Bacillus vallismortis]MBG9769329.1 SAM-dependent methyltransferase [Bacillus vallismortis]MCY7894717.1 class I SAM-dependent methyltransferase [Bacillus vallismortis]MCY8547668.1 class I SAM-dependent methyltransferase [Bacillus vallismortis]MEC1270564.1 class I SAM-dependent methyltransferase [Bacillus vallismortis]QAV10323.1 SAM-dependent methyltransferase [Bacillus vallismortis]